MSATKYSLELVGVNRMSPAINGAAADSRSLTGALFDQQKAARALDKTQKKLGDYTGLRQSMAATRGELKKNQLALKGLAAEQGAARQSVQSLAAAKQAASKKAQRLEQSIAAVGVPTAAMTAKFKAARTEADRLGAELETERSRLSDIGEQFGATRADAQRLKSELEDQRGQAHKLGNELREAGVDSQKFSGEQSRLRREAAQATSAIEAQKAALKKLGAARARVSAADARMGEAQGNLAGTAAMAAAAIVPIARAVTMEAAMADVAKVVSFQGNEKDRFQAGLQKLAVEVNVPPEQLTKIAAAAGQSGVAKSEIANFTGAAARMGVAFDMTAEQAGDTMASWRAGMSLNQQQTEQLADAVNHLSNNSKGKVDARSISGVLKRNGADAMASGLSSVQAASVASALLSGGATEEVAATGMKNMLGALTKGWAASSSQKEAMGRVGLDAEDVSVRMQQDATGTIKDVFAAIAGADAADQSALVSQIFGEEGKGMFMSLLKNTELLDSAFAQTAAKASYEGSYLKEYKERAGVAEHKLGSAWRAIDRLGIVLGNSLLPIVGPLADGAAWAASGLADLAEKGGVVTSVVTGAAAVFVTYKAGLLAWQLISAKAEQMRARSALTTANREAQLAARTGSTATQAGLATRALDRLNRSLGRTSGAAALGGGGPDRRPGDRRPDDTGRRPSRRGGRRGRLGRLIGRGWEGAKAMASSRAGQAAGVGLSTAALMAASDSVSAQSMVAEAGDAPARLLDPAEMLDWRKAGAKADQLQAASTVAAADVAARLADKTANMAEQSEAADQALGWLNSTLGVTATLARVAMGKPVRRSAHSSAPPSAHQSAASISATPGASADADSFDLLGTASDVVGGVSDLLGSVGGMATKLLKPLDLVLQVGGLGSAVASGDATEIGSSAGDIVGGAAGMWAGGAAGAAIGSVVPIVGTVIGGAIGAALGGFFGGEAGSWAGEEVAQLVAPTDAPAEQVAKTSDVTPKAHKDYLSPYERGLVNRAWEENHARGESALKKADKDVAATQRVQQNQQVTFAPQLTVQAAPGADAEHVANLAMDKLKALFDQQLMPALNPSLQNRLDDSLEITA